MSQPESSAFPNRNPPKTCRKRSAAVPVDHIMSSLSYGALCAKHVLTWTKSLLGDPLFAPRFAQLLLPKGKGVPRSPKPAQLHDIVPSHKSRIHVLICLYTFRRRLSRKSPDRASPVSASEPPLSASKTLVSLGNGPGVSLVPEVEALHALQHQL